MQVMVTPTLPDDGPPLTLMVTPSNNPHTGTVMINGGQTFDVRENTTIQLNAGDTQTERGSAGQLRLTVQVDGRNTVQSHGFSVSAIPENWTVLYYGRAALPEIGFFVLDGWISDSGDLSDLGEIAMSEQVEYPVRTGFFAGGVPHNSGYIYHNRTGGLYATDPLDPLNSFDLHSFGPAPGHALALHAGTLEAHQTSEFIDYRSGAHDIPIDNSGYILRTVIIPNGAGFIVLTTEEGAATSAHGIASNAGTALPSPIVQLVPTGAIIH
jgi:hypothetical protein